MKAATHTQLVVVLVCLRLLALPVWAGDAPGSGIAGGAHDFTYAAGGGVNQANGDAATCISCHVRHSMPNSPSGVEGTQVAWNDNLSAQSFSWSDATHTTGGTRLPNNLGTWGGSSKLCLSCHDGTISARSEYRPAGDLKGNHPVGVPYPYRGAPSTYNGITTGTEVELTHYVTMPPNVKLFTQLGNSVIEGVQIGATGIECASCHDVHNKNVRDRQLLRDTKTQLCLDCHNR